MGKKLRLTVIWSPSQTWKRGWPRATFQCLGFLCFIIFVSFYFIIKQICNSSSEFWIANVVKEYKGRGWGLIYSVLVVLIPLKKYREFRSFKEHSQWYVEFEKFVNFLNSIYHRLSAEKIFRAGKFQYAPTPPSIIWLGFWTLKRIILDIFTLFFFFWRTFRKLLILISAFYFLFFCYIHLPYLMLLHSRFLEDIFASNKKNSRLKPTKTTLNG